MDFERQSFLSNIMGHEYRTIKSHAPRIIAVGTCILLVLYLLSSLFYIKLISNLLNLFTGTSVLFIAYIVSFIVALDIEVWVKTDYYAHKKPSKPKAYKISIGWEILLVILGISAIYFSNKYRKHYAFESSTFLVDNREGIYHLDYPNRCEVRTESTDLQKMKGFKIKETEYKLCEWCDIWAEDAESEFGSSRYYRR